MTNTTQPGLTNDKLLHVRRLLAQRRPHHVPQNVLDLRVVAQVALVLHADGVLHSWCVNGEYVLHDIDCDFQID